MATLQAPIGGLLLLGLVYFAVQHFLCSWQVSYRCGIDRWQAIRQVSRQHRDSHSGSRCSFKQDGRVIELLSPTPSGVVVGTRVEVLQHLPCYCGRLVAGDRLGSGDKSLKATSLRRTVTV